MPARHRIVPEPPRPDLDALAAAADEADRKAVDLCAACLGAESPEPFEAYAAAEERADAARRAHAEALPARTHAEAARRRVALDEAERRGKQGRALARLARENAAELGRRC